ncbi:nitroreductase [Pullulanibacillus pueri]|uniref:Putative NAD(P)H nitroreductase n=1 Tax=Pullulanibacillus pueri TaxID=1437324 RepID=A0A8J2ZXL9_9BACL|nr:nitroreductase [Pullulanibacillus pueri]MBM7683022.1 nitroreductase [Pullulanibacillus pueri]GGH85040.1 nitroreductase [Pullulanibacillus pueri]
MELMDVIKQRRSIGKVTEEVPKRELIEKLLESARWAPNHYRTEPFSFVVLSGKGRDKLGDVYGRINVEELESTATDEEKKEAYEKGLKKARRAPYIIIVRLEPGTASKVVFAEEIAATACAVQNLLLTATDLGLGAIWRSGQPSYHQFMKEAFQVSEEGLVLGFVYVGYPAQEPKTPPKKELIDMVEWIED